MRTLKKLNKADIRIIRIELTNNDMLLPDTVRVRYNEVYDLWQIVFAKKYGRKAKQLNISLPFNKDVDELALERQLEREFVKPKPLPKGTILVKYLPAFPHRKLGKKDAEKLTKAVSKAKRKTDAKD